MVSSMASLLFLCLCTFASAGSASSLCPLHSAFFVKTLDSECPLSPPTHSLLQVDGSFLDKTLSSNLGNAYMSVLFYASWCQFSRSMHPKFEALSFKFPQIEHLAIEQSSAMPSVFSRYGIHSLPALVIMNQTSKVRYHGPQNLLSLVQFYKKVTGLEPVQWYAGDHISSVESTTPHWNWSSLSEIFSRECYLVLSISLLCLRVLLSKLSMMLSLLKAFWALYAPCMNLEIFGEAGQILRRAVDMIDLKMVWTKLGFYPCFCLFIICKIIILRLNM